MQVLFFKALWGMDEPVPAAIERIAAAGYDGFETPMHGVIEARNAGIDFPAVGMLFPQTPDELAAGLDEMPEVVRINCHAGRHAMSFSEGCTFFEAALKIVEKAGRPVSFETHRGRLLYEPQSTFAYLSRFPELTITADFSHWTCVCESLLGDQSEAVDLAISRTAMLHARVGHEEGPQVPDPRTDRWIGHVEHFEKWWDAILESARSRGEQSFIVDPEFGPPSYLWTDPQGERPLADLWDVCLWTRDRLKSRWA